MHADQFYDRAISVLERIENRLRRIDRRIKKLEQRLDNDNQHDVTSGEIHRIEDKPMGSTTTNLPPLGPGVSAKFQVAWLEGASPDPNTVAANTVWTSSDPVNFPAVIDPNDPTGATADVAIPAGETTTESVTLTATYTNPDGTTATASASFDLVGGVVTPVDVTGGSISRIA